MTETLAQNGEVVSRPAIVTAYADFYQLMRQSMLRGCDAVEDRIMSDPDIAKYGNDMNAVHQACQEKYDRVVAGYFYRYKRVHIEKIPAQYHPQVINCGLYPYEIGHMLNRDPLRKLLKIELPFVKDRLDAVATMSLCIAFFKSFPLEEIKRRSQGLIFSDKREIDELRVVFDFRTGRICLNDQNQNLIFLPELEIKTFLNEQLYLIEATQIAGEIEL